MREYLFRGKAKFATDTNGAGDFVYGLLTKAHNEYFINDVPVNPDTIGQYLLNDVNGEKIFEGDLVVFQYLKKIYNCDTLGAEKAIAFIGVVQVDQWGNYAVPIRPFPKSYPIKPKYYFAEYLTGPDDELKIMGNIYDHPIVNQPDATIKEQFAIPPGATIKEQLEDWHMPLKNFANRMGMTEKIAVKLMNGNISLTEEIAEKLEGIFNIPATFWLNMETLYRKKLKMYLKM